MNGAPKGKSRFLKATGLTTILVMASGMLGVTAKGTIVYAETSGTTTFTYTGQEQTYTVPQGVRLIQVTAIGGEGAGGSGGSLGGHGADVNTYLPVTPGETLYVVVGGNAAGAQPGYNGGGSAFDNITVHPGGGGGGATDIQTDPTKFTPLVVAGGGGGGGGTSQDNQGQLGGNGGDAGAVAGSGSAGGSVSDEGYTWTSGGGGGAGGDAGGAGGHQAVDLLAGKVGAPGKGGSQLDGGNAGIGTEGGADGGGGGGGYVGGGGGASGYIETESSGSPLGASGGGGGAGSSYVTPQAEDTSIATDTSGTPEVSITPALGMTTDTLPPASVGDMFSTQFQATDGVGPYVWSLADGSELPDGVHLDATSGKLSGVPTSAGTYHFSIDVEDSSTSLSITVPYTLSVNPPSVDSVDGLSHSNVTTSGWTESWLPVTGVDGYDVYLNGQLVGSTSNTVYDVYGADPATRYQLSVAGEVYGVDGTSAVDMVYTPPDAPTGLTHGEVTSSAWKESWEPVAGAESYNVYLNGNKVGSTQQAYYNFSDVQPSTQYAVNVSTVEGVYGESALSASDSVTTSAPPSTGGSSSTSGSSSTGGSSSAQTPSLPTTIFEQTVDADGGTWAQAVGQTSLSVNVPPGAFTSAETLSVTTGTPQDLSSTISGINEKNTAVVVGIQFSGAAPTQPVTVTIENPDIMPSSTVYKIGANGDLAPVKAVVSKGKCIVSFTTDPNFVVLDTKPNERVIVLGNQVHIVPAIVKLDGGTQTTYMPIWYVMQMLKPLGIDSTWNGAAWNVSTASTVKLSSLNVGTGHTSVYLNHQLVQRVNTIAAADPSTNRPTTYMPIWYVQQLLGRLGLQSTWSGSTWAISNESVDN